MAVTLSAGRQKRRRPKPARLVGLVAAWAVAAAVWAEEPPVADAADEAVAAARACARELDWLRPPSADNADRVAATLRKGLAALDGADAALAKQLDQLAPEKKPPRGTTNPKTAAELTRLRSRRCEVGLARGDLYYHAALAMPEGHAARAEHLEKAVATFRSLRVDFHDIAPGLMGYIGEARAQRAAGDVQAARDALKTIDQIPQDPKNPLAGDLRRLAMIEDLEALLAAEPDKVPAAAQTLSSAKEFADQPEWQARVDYVLARACAAQAEKRAAAGSADAQRKELAAKAAALLRRPAVVAIAAPYDRLAALLKLETLLGEPLMQRDELLAWADLLAAAGRHDAIAFYNRATGASGQPLAERQLFAYISLATKQGQYRETADACDRLLGMLAAGDARRPVVLQWRAAALLKAVRAAGTGPPTADIEARGLAALAAVIGSPSPDAVRRDALRQWVAMTADRNGLAACLRMLADHEALVTGDAYLVYCRAAGRWQQLAEELGADAVEKTEAERRARQVVADLEAAFAAAAAGDPAILARSALLRARALARPPLADLRGALGVLDASAAALAADAAVAGAAAWLRVEVLLDLGLIEEASKALDQVPEGSDKTSPLARLRLAEALAARYAGIARAGGRDEVQRRVLGLCDAALAQAATDETLFVEASRRAARAMLDIQAHADARRVLDQLLASPKVRENGGLLETCSLLMAEAYRCGRQLNQALGLLEQLAARFPESVEVHMALGRCELDVRRPVRAVESFRKARGLCRPGTPPWCQATLALAEGLAAGNHDADAADVLRVAEALHPDFGDPELRSHLQQMRLQVENRLPREKDRQRP